MKKTSLSIFLSFLSSLAATYVYSFINNNDTKISFDTIFTHSSNINTALLFLLFSILFYLSYLSIFKHFETKKIKHETEEKMVKKENYIDEIKKDFENQMELVKPKLKELEEYYNIKNQIVAYFKENTSASIESTIEYIFIKNESYYSKKDISAVIGVMVNKDKTLKEYTKGTLTLK